MTTPPNHNTEDQSGAMQPASSASSADERPTFEAWYLKEVDHRANFKGTDANVVGWYYFDDDTDIAWSAWKERSAIVPQVVQAPSNESVKTATKVFQSIFFNAGHDGESAYEQMQRAMRAAIISSEYVAAPIVATGDLSTTVPSEFKDQMLSLCDAQRIDQSEMACCDTCSGLTYNDACDDLKRKIRELASPSPTEQASDVQEEREAGIYDRGFAFGVLAGWNAATQPEEFTVSGDQYRNPPADDSIIRRAQKTIEETRQYIKSAPAAKGNAQDEAKS